MFRIPSLSSLLSVSVVSAAVISSMATSAPLWVVTDNEKGAVVVPRGESTDLAIDLFASADALPDVEGGVAPQGGSTEGGLASSLAVSLDFDTRGVFGTNRESTTVVAELWMHTDEGSFVVDDLEVEVEPGAWVETELLAMGVLAHCIPNENCEAFLSVEVTQSDEARLKMKYDARLRIQAPMMGPAPKEAEVEVVVTEG